MRVSSNAGLELKHNSSARVLSKGPTVNLEYFKSKDPNVKCPQRMFNCLIIPVLKRAAAALCAGCQVQLEARRGSKNCFPLRHRRPDPVLRAAGAPKKPKIEGCGRAGTP